jgi:fructose-specific phosphotransferase system component IIB
MVNIQTPDTIGEENVPITGAQQVLTKDAVKQKIEDRISDLKAKAQSSQGEQTQPAQTSDSNTGTGMDKEDIKNAIQSISASSIPVDKNTFNSTDNVQPSTSSMLTNKASLTEGFCPCAASIVF